MVASLHWGHDVCYVAGAGMAGRQGGREAGSQGDREVGRQRRGREGEGELLLGEDGKGKRMEKE